MMVGKRSGSWQHSGCLLASQRKEDQKEAVQSKRQPKGPFGPLEFHVGCLGRSKKQKAWALDPFVPWATNFKRHP